MQRKLLPRWPRHARPSAARSQQLPGLPPCHGSSLRVARGIRRTLRLVSPRRLWFEMQRHCAELGNDAAKTKTNTKTKTNQSIQTSNFLGEILATSPTPHQSISRVKTTTPHPAAGALFRIRTDTERSSSCGLARSLSVPLAKQLTMEVHSATKTSEKITLQQSIFVVK